MAICHKPSFLLSSSSFVMSALLAYASAIHWDDPDCYLWLPLYALASLVNLLQSARICKRNKWVAGFTSCGAILLFLKVVYKAYGHGGFGEISLLDVSQRLVRDKIGSGMVAINMFFQYKAADVAESPVRVEREKIWRTVEYGMAVLVAMSFGLVMTFIVLLRQMHSMIQGNVDA